MNKKVKWSVISVSTITALTFGGLVMNNEKAASNEKAAPENDLFREKLALSNEDDGYEEREGNGEDYYEEHDFDDDDDGDEEHDDDDGDEEHDDDDDDDDHFYEEHGDNRLSNENDQGPSWGQDQIIQAPDRGFRQDQGSSGTSR